LKTWKGHVLNTPRCLHCGSEFKRARSKILTEVVLCNCKSSSKTSIDLNRFCSGFTKDRATKLYSEHVQNKIKKWKPKNCDTSSLKAKISRHGEALGNSLFQKSSISKNTTGIKYFLKKTDNDFEKAKILQKQRQSTGRIEKFVERNGLEEGIKLWLIRNKKWAETVSSRKELQKTSSIPQELIKERDRKIQYKHYVGILTKISARMFEDQINQSSESKNGIRHLDHQYSISAGFLNRVNIKFIAFPRNLKWLSKSENLAKKCICAIDGKNLESLYSEWIINDPRHKLFDDICETLQRHWRNDGAQI